MKALEGKAAVVTGASRGIGAGIAKEFAAQGARVVVNYLSGEAGAAAVVEYITSNGGTAIAVQADVSDKDDVERLFDAEKGGSIINLTSQGAANPPMYSAVYSATKGAINSLTLELARELGPRGIRVNALASGATATEGAADLGLTEGSEFAGQFVAQTPLGRLGTPEDLAKAAVFLASDESQWVTGDVIKATGGMI
jgi:3-oxoacyl-[acyl-carrier protein] reductase